MIYTKTEKKELDKVRGVFAEHLRQCPDFELLWSDKVGYVWLAIGLEPLYVDTGRRIESAEDLCRECLESIGMDVLYITDNDHGPTTTVWRMPIHWSAQRSAGAGIPSWISSRSLPIFAKRFSRKRTNAKACRLPHEGKSAGSVYWQNQSRPGAVAGIGKIRWARPIFLPLTGSAGSAMSSD